MQLLPLLLLACGPKTAPDPAAEAPAEALTERGDLVETLHGVEVADPYRWLEDAEDEAVQSWTAERNADFDAHTEALAQREWLYDRYQTLWRYDDESTPSPCLLSERIVYWTKDADEDKWVVHMKEGPDDEVGRVLIDPNTWAETETLARFTPSPDCRYAVYGVANAGDEDAKFKVMDLDTLETMDDTFQGWKLGGVTWLHDNSGFYYSGKPREGEVPEDEHFYWHRVWFHALGNQAEDDELFFWDDEVKEHWHGTGLSEDGRWLVRFRGIFNKNTIWLRPADQPDAEWRQVTGDMDADYGLQIFEDTLLITTDRDASTFEVFQADPDDPGPENWTSFIPASEDTLSYLVGVAGQLYAVYKHDAATRIAVYDLDGTWRHDMELPTVGTAGVWGHWSRDTTWASFSSFAHPSAVYTYDAQANELALYKDSPVTIDPALVADIDAEQIWYESKDGTPVSMFVVRRKDAPLDGSVPFLLYGYGGFNISMNPRFSTVYATWIEAGGGVAIPNLRGGGEYGRDWHEAGMLDRKQNVFDDFIAAAEWLIDNDYTSADRLAISGGSNGGLLVSAVVTQRPELYRAVLCQVPLTDMVRYHVFGLANIWSEEYGNADDPDQFTYLRAYSPYHNVAEGADYPAILVTGSENDARTDPVHARKFYAAAQWADADRGAAEPILLHIQSDSGHGGGVTIDTQADQEARHMGFLMAEIGLEAPAPSAPPEDGAPPEVEE